MAAYSATGKERESEQKKRDSGPLKIGNRAFFEWFDF